MLNFPGLEVFPGDLLVSDGAADYLCRPLLLLNPGPDLWHTYITLQLWEGYCNKQGDLQNIYWPVH